MIRIVKGTDSEIHTFYELLRIYFPYYETSGELFLSIETKEDVKEVVLVIGDDRFEKDFFSTMNVRRSAPLHRGSSETLITNQKKIVFGER